jgi:hypothetical protein
MLNRSSLERFCAGGKVQLLERTFGRTVHPHTHTDRSASDAETRGRRGTPSDAATSVSRPEKCWSRRSTPTGMQFAAARVNGRRNAAKSLD